MAAVRLIGVQGVRHERDHPRAWIDGPLEAKVVRLELGALSLRLAVHSPARGRALHLDLDAEDVRTLAQVFREAAERARN